MGSRHAASPAEIVGRSLVEGRLGRYLEGLRPVSSACAADVFPAWVQPVSRQVVVEYRGLHILLEPASASGRRRGSPAPGNAATAAVEPPVEALAGPAVEACACPPTEVVEPAVGPSIQPSVAPPLVPRVEPPVAQPVAPPVAPPVVDAPPSSELARWAESLVMADASDGETLGLLRATQRLIAWATALQVDAVAELCARRVQSAEYEVRAAQSSGDLHQLRSASRGLDMAERAVCDEIALELGCTRWLADRLVTTALTLTRELPATHDALRAGTLDPRKAETLAVGLGELSDPVLKRHAERLALEVAPVLNVPTLRERIKQAVLRVQPEAAAEAAARAREERRVIFRSAPDDMLELWALLPADDGARLRACLDLAADRAGHPGDPRTADQRRLDTMVDAVTGLVHGDAAPARASGAFSASEEPAAADPAVVNPAVGNPAVGNPAAANPAVVNAAGREPPVTTPNGPPQASTERSVRGSRRSSGPKHQVILTVPFATVTGDAEEPGFLSGYGPVSADLARRMAWDVAADGTWRCAVVDDKHGTLLGLGTSTFTPGYQASAALGRHVMTRDRVCRFTGCRAAAVRCDIDHRVPYPQGCSCECNTEALCAHHHRVKHETAFRVRVSEDVSEPPGTLVWTTPGGRDYLDRPARLSGPPPF